MRNLLAAIAIFAITACSGLTMGGIGERQATAASKAELARRRIDVSRMIVRVTKSTFTAEVGPEFTIYIVKFIDPDRRAPVPLYTINVRADNGEIQTFIDTHILRRSN